MELFLRPEYTIKVFFNLGQECIFYNFMSFCYSFWCDPWKTEWYFLSLNRFPLP